MFSNIYSHATIRRSWRPVVAPYGQISDGGTEARPHTNTRGHAAVAARRAAGRPPAHASKPPPPAPVPVPPARPRSTLHDPVDPLRGSPMASLGLRRAHMMLLLSDVI